MSARRLRFFATLALCSLQALAEGSGDRLSSMAGTWDVTPRMWPSPRAAAISLPPHAGCNREQPTDRAAVSHAAGGAAQEGVPGLRVRVFQEAVRRSAIEHLDLALQRDQQRLTLAVFRLARRHLHPALADAVLL